MAAGSALSGISGISGVEAGEPTGFVAVSRFTVANGMTAAVREAFRRRPGLVEDAPGFRKLDVLSPHENPDEILLVTYWSDRSRYEDWHRSHTYKESHRGIPKGLKLVPRSDEMMFFDHICS